MKDINIEYLNDYLKCLNYDFINPPLIVGGLAMEYYSARKNGSDIDVMVSEEDWKNLKEKYLESLNLFGGNTEDEVDATLNVEIEYNNSVIHVDLIKTLWKHDYLFFKKNSVNHIISYKLYYVISIRDLLMIKSLPGLIYSDKKSLNDINLLANKIKELQYKDK